MYNFDERINRDGTYSCKWEKYKGTDILPMWIADTEFKVAPAIQDALRESVDHGVFGYHIPAQYEPANRAVIDWCKKEYDWEIQPSWIVWTPGVCPGFNIAIKALCEPGDHVIIQTPNYPPILAAPGINQCEAVHVDTLWEDGQWHLDFAALEQAASHPKAKLMVLCNPMNPVGRVLSQDEINRIAQICSAHTVVLCSDEIHCDLILDDLPHHPAGKQPSLADRSITLMAPNKTFNIAGLGAAYAIIPNPSLRHKFNLALRGHVPWVNYMGLVATSAALTQCDDWLVAQKQYLRGNRDYLVEAINQIEGLKAHSPEATFLLWVDASGLDVEDVQQWAEAKGVGPSPGKDFNLASFFRLNYGVSRSMLEDVVARLKS